MSKPRLPPLPEAEWTPEVREILTPLQRGGRVFNIFSTLAAHPRLLKRWLAFGGHVLGGSTLPARDREIAILRVGWLCRCEYEWGQHAVIGQAAGLSPDEVRRVTEGPAAPGWAPFEATLLRAVDELHSDYRIGDATWAALAERYDEKKLLDLVFTVGQYTLVSMALKTLGVELDPGLQGFPQ